MKNITGKRPLVNTKSVALAGGSVVNLLKWIPAQKLCGNDASLFGRKKNDNKEISGGLSFFLSSGLFGFSRKRSGRRLEAVFGK